MSFPVKFPQFSGEKADETWKGYKASIELAYAVSGQTFEEPQRAALMLNGLTGKARKYLELHPELLTKTYKEVDQILGERFGKASAKNLLDITSVVQKPGESVLEFVSRLKTAAEVLQEDSFKPTITTQEEIEDMGPEAAKKLNVFTPEEYQKARNLVVDSFHKFLMPHFIRGLKPELRQVVTQGRPETFEAAVQAAEDHEKFMESFGNLSIAGISHVQGHEIKNPMMEEISAQLKELNKQKTEAPDNDKENNGEVNYVEDRTCFYCKRPGHLKSQCRLRIQHYRDNQEEIVPRYRPYPGDRRQYSNNRRSYYNDHPANQDNRPQYSHDRRQYGGNRRSYQEDPREPDHRYRQDRDGQSSPAQRGAHMQPRVRNMRPQGFGGGGEIHPRIAGTVPEPRRVSPRVNNYSQLPEIRMAEEEEERSHPVVLPQRRAREIPLGEINHQYIMRGPKRFRKSQDGQESKNGERRSLNRGPRLPAPRQPRRFVRLTQMH